MEAVALGRANPNGELVTFSLADRFQHLYVIGSTGAGKSTLILNMALQDIYAGRGICLLDPKADLVTRLLPFIPPERSEDVVLLDVRDPQRSFGINILECADPSKFLLVDMVVSQALGIFEKVWNIKRDNPTMSMYARNVIFTLLYNKTYTLVDIPHLFQQQSFRNKMLANVPNDSVVAFWRDYYEQLPQRMQLDESRSVYNKIDEAIGQTIIKHVVGQSQTTVNLRHLMDSQKIILIPMGQDLGPQLIQLLGSLFVALIKNAMFSRTDTPEEERVPFFLYADEYWYYATNDFAEILTQARAFKVACTVAHQDRSQIDWDSPVGIGQIGSKVVFRPADEDTRYLADFFSLPPPAELPIDPNPVTHLLDHGHPDPFVQQRLIDWIQDILDTIESLKSAGTQYDYRLGERLDRLQTTRQNLNLYLLYVMDRRLDVRSEESAKWLRRLVVGARRYDERDSKAEDPPLMRLINALLFNSADVEAASTELVDERDRHNKRKWPQYYSESDRQKAEVEMTQMCSDLEMLIRAAEYLAANPLYAAPSGHTVSTTDQRNRLEDELKKLGRGQAHCKILQNNIPTEYRLDTLPPGTGTRPIYQVVQSPLNQLIEEPEKHQPVRRYLEIIAKALERVADDDDTSYPGYDGGFPSGLLELFDSFVLSELLAGLWHRYHIRGQELRTGVNILNAYVRDMMCKIISPRSDQDAERITDVLIRLRGFLQLAPDLELLMVPPGLLLNFRLNMPASSQSALRRLCQWLVRQDLVDKPLQPGLELQQLVQARTEYWQQELELRSPQPVDTRATQVRVRDWAFGGPSPERLQAARELGAFDKGQEIDLHALYNWVEREFKQQVGDTRQRWQQIIARAQAGRSLELEALATQRADYEATQAYCWVLAIASIGRYAADHPIFDPTPEYELVQYERLEATESRQRIEQVRQRSSETYGKERAAIDAEIQARQNVDQDRPIEDERPEQPPDKPTSPRRPGRGQKI